MRGIYKNVEKKARKRKNWKILYISKKRYRYIIQEAEIKYVRIVKYCTRTDQLINENIWIDRGILSLYEIITEYTEKWKLHLQRKEQILVPLQALTIVLLANETWGDQD
jgi:hypothetical protein